MTGQLAANARVGLDARANPQVARLSARSRPKLRSISTHARHPQVAQCSVSSRPRNARTDRSARANLQAARCSVSSRPTFGFTSSHAPTSQAARRIASSWPTLGFTSSHAPAFRRRGAASAHGRRSDLPHRPRQPSGGAMQRQLAAHVRTGLTVRTPTLRRRGRAPTSGRRTDLPQDKVRANLQAALCGACHACHTRREYGDGGGRKLPQSRALLEAPLEGSATQ